MKITGYEIFKVPPRWLFLKIVTDEGIVGWGEATLEGKAVTVAAAVSEFMKMMVGKDPLDIEDHWNVLYRGSFYRGGPVLMSAIAGIDQALWDIKGKFHNTPVYNLLGGKCRSKIEVYSWVGGDSPEVVIEEIEKIVDKGFKTIKINGTDQLRFLDSFQKVDALLERMSLIRERFGRELNVGIDFHGRVHKPMAGILMDKLAEFDPLFVEEPLLPENFEGIVELAKKSSIPIALGERLYSRWDFKQVVKSGSIDIIQPDVAHAGGISECRKIATMAEAYDIALALHCPIGPIALAACLQLDAVCYNATLQEQSMGIHYNTNMDLLDYVSNPEIFEYRDGFVNIPEGPGLGISINEDHVRKMQEIGQDWHNPLWRNVDGAIAEW